MIGRDGLLWFNCMLGASLAHAALIYQALALPSVQGADEDALPTRITIAAPARMITKKAASEDADMVVSSRSQEAKKPVSQRLGALETERKTAHAPLAAEQRLAASGDRTPLAPSNPTVPVASLKQDSANADSISAQPNKRTPLRSEVAVLQSTGTPVANPVAAPIANKVLPAAQAPSQRVASISPQETQSSNRLTEQPVESATARPVTGSRSQRQSASKSVKTLPQPTVEAAVSPSNSEAPTISEVVTTQVLNPGSVTEKRQIVAAIDQGAQTGQTDGSRGGRTQKPTADEKFQHILRFLENVTFENCSAVVPRIARNGLVTMQGFSPSQDQWRSIQEQASDLLGAPLPIASAPVTPTQCAAVDFAKQLRNYPRFTLHLDLESETLRNGQDLKASLSGIYGRHSHLLIVDDEGYVQSADALLKPSPSGLSISTSVFLTDGAVETAQMLVALTVDAPIDIITPELKMKSDVFFPQLKLLLEASRQDTDLALAPFYVR